MKKLTTRQFIDKARDRHAQKYLYDHVIFIDVKSKVVIECKIHGLFEQTPNSHLNGHGCSKCAWKDKHPTSNVYMIVDESNTPKYIGQTVHKLEKRLRQHIWKPKSKKLKLWFMGMVGTPKIKMLAPDVLIDDIDELEQFFIHEFSERYPLLNTTHNPRT